MPCCANFGRICTTWFSAIVCVLSLLSIVIYIIGFAVGLSKTDPPEGLTRRHVCQMTFILSAFITDALFLWAIFTDRLARTICHIILFFVMVSVTAAGGCLAISAQYFEACYATQGEKVIQIDNLGTSCGYSFVAFIGAFVYAFLAILKMYAIQCQMNKGGAEKMKDAELEGVGRI